MTCFGEPNASGVALILAIQRWYLRRIVQGNEPPSAFVVLRWNENLSSEGSSILDGWLLRIVLRASLK